MILLTNLLLPRYERNSINKAEKKTSVFCLLPRRRDVEPAGLFVKRLLPNQTFRLRLFRRAGG